MIGDLQKRRRLGRFRLRRRVAIVRRDREGREMHRHADGRLDVRWPRRDLVEPSQDHHALDTVLAGLGVGDDVMLRHAQIHDGRVFGHGERQGRGKARQRSPKDKRPYVHLLPELFP